MTRLEQLERLLSLVDEASEVIRRLPEDNRLRVHSRELEGSSNGGFYNTEEEVDNDYFFLRDHIELQILKEKGELPADLDPGTI
jgi:hypothetical protein